MDIVQESYYVILYMNLGIDQGNLWNLLSVSVLRVIWRHISNIYGVFNVLFSIAQSSVVSYACYGVRTIIGIRTELSARVVLYHN